MPAETHVKKAFSLIENDSSKLLGLKVGDQVIQPGQHVSRQGLSSIFIIYIKAFSDRI